MLPTPVEEAIRGMAEDRTSGASKLARLAVDTMGLAIVNAKGRPDPKELAEVARRISEAQPAMAIVHNVAQLVARLVSEGLDPKAVLLEIRTELDRARERIARTFLKVVPPHATIVTLSYSDNVLEAIKMAHGRAHGTRRRPTPHSRSRPRSSSPRSSRSGERTGPRWSAPCCLRDGSRAGPPRRKVDSVPSLTLNEWWNPNRPRASTRSNKASASSTRNTSSRPTRSWRISGNGNTASRSCSSRGSSRYVPHTTTSRTGT